MLVEVKCAVGQGTEEWGERDWSMRKLAAFEGSKGEENLAFDAYLKENKVIGASASLGTDNYGNPSARITVWESEQSS